MDSTYLPDDVQDAGEEILHQTIRCPRTNRGYRIHQKELEICRKLEVALPRFHPEERHAQRSRLRNPRKLAARKCSECGCVVVTACDAHQKKRVACESCYLKLIF